MNFEIIDSFKAAMVEHGIDPPQTIIPDGQSHRFKIDGKLNGFYVLHLDGRAAGCFQDWRQHSEPIKWKDEGCFKRLTAEERQNFVQQRQIEQAARQQDESAKHEKAVRKARYIWNHAKPATTHHAYLMRKQILSHGARLGSNEALILPLLNSNFELVNLQFVFQDGTKRFLTGGRKKGCFWFIGKPTQKILIAEGFATAASIYQHTGQQCFIAFDAGNLMHVAKAVRRMHQQAEVIIMADNDMSGKGQKEAHKAALAVNGLYMVCPDAGKDFNDYLSAQGL